MEDGRWEFGVPSGSASRQYWISENAQPTYAEGFGVAGAHLSRRSESEGGTSNAEVRMHRKRLMMRLEQAK